MKASSTRVHRRALYFHLIFGHVQVGVGVRVHVGDNGFQVGVSVGVKVMVGVWVGQVVGVEVVVTGGGVGVRVKVTVPVEVGVGVMVGMWTVKEAVGVGMLGWTGLCSSMGRPQWITARANKARSGKRA
jgi:hypothetical protein